MPDNKGTRRSAIPFLIAHNYSQTILAFRRACTTVEIAVRRSPDLVDQKSQGTSRPPKEARLPKQARTHRLPDALESHTAPLGSYRHRPAARSRPSCPGASLLPGAPVPSADQSHVKETS